MKMVSKALFVVLILLVVLEGTVSAQDSAARQDSAAKIDKGLSKTKGMTAVFVRMSDQLLGESGDYEKFCAAQPKTTQRLELRKQVMKTLHKKSDDSYSQVRETVARLVEKGQISQPQRHWIVNGFNCRATSEACRVLAALEPIGFVYRQHAWTEGRTAKREKLDPDSPQYKLYERLLKDLRDDTQDPFDPSGLDIPWNLKRIRVDRAWDDHGVTGRGVVVAVIDSGMMAIPALIPSLWHNSDEALNGKDDDGNGYVDDVFGYNFLRGSPYCVSESRPAHGTLCAGIIAGRPSSQPKRIITGIAPRSKVMPLCGSGRLSVYEYALREGADVVSMSYTIDAQNLGHFRGLFRTAHEHLAVAGVVSVGGAGNYARSRPVGWQIGTPKDIPCVIAAAGITEDGNIAPASSRGPVSWAGVRYYDPDPSGVPLSKPNVTACFGGYPMWTRVSVWEGRKKDRLQVVQKDGHGYVLALGPRGNSFSGPHAAGVAALMLEANPQLPVWHLQRMMEETCTDLGEPGRDTTFGAGLLQADQAVAAVHAFSKSPAP